MNTSHDRCHRSPARRPAARARRGSRPCAHHAFAAEFDGKAPGAAEGQGDQGRVDQPARLGAHRTSSKPDGRRRSGWSRAARPTPCCARGIDRNSLKPGTDIIVRGYQSKDKRCTPACKANGRDVTFPDGRKLFMGSSGTGAPKDGADPTDMPK